MPSVKISKIQVKDRYRKDLGDIKQLAEDMAQYGQLQPIVLDEEYTLLAGERRLRAAEHLKWEEIRATIVSADTELAHREIELMENLSRKDMTWPEEVALKKKIHELQVAKQGSKASVRDTAKLLSQSKSTLYDDLHLADALEIVPELKACASKKDAEKQFFKIVEQQVVRELAERQLKRQLEEGVEEAGELNLDDIYRVGDCVAGLGSLSEGEGFTIAEVDPPYAIGLHGLRVGEVPEDYCECDADDYPTLISDVARELYRVLEPDAWVIWWYGPTHQQLVLNTLKHYGFKVDEIPCIWLKNRGQTMQPNVNFARFWEPFFLARKGNPKLYIRGRANVFSFDGVAAQSRIHPTERPVELIQEILGHLTAPGVGKVIVPFLGSGNSVIAAKRLGLEAIGWDLKGDTSKVYFIERYLKEVERLSKEQTEEATA